MLYMIWKAVPPVYPGGSVVGLSITSCSIQRIPFHAYNFHVSQIVLNPEGNFCKIQADGMVSICRCVAEFDIVLGECSLVNSSEVLRYNCAHVSEYGMRCLQYIPLARW